MKKQYLAILIPAIMLTLSGCFRDNFVTGISGKGEKVTETRYTGSFTGVDLNISCNVYITQGDEEEVTIRAQRNIIENLETNVNSGMLKFKHRRHVRRHDGIDIYVTVRDIDALEVSGSGDIVCEDGFSAGYLELKVSGSGSIRLENFTANEIESKISGSGDIMLSGSGTVERYYSKISGSGSVSAYSLPVNHMEADISGSGQCKVNALSTLVVEISGSGDVFYIGSPVITTHISGSGSVVNAN